MITQNAGVIAAEERAHAAALLYRYPDLPDEDLAWLHNWFNRVATPLDIGILASDAEAAAGYRAYRADHYDRFKPRDLVGAALFIGVVLAVVVMIALLKP